MFGHLTFNSLLKNMCHEKINTKAEETYKGRRDFLWRNGRVFVLRVDRRFGRGLRIDHGALAKFRRSRTWSSGHLDYRRRMDGRRVDWSTVALQRDFVTLALDILNKKRKQLALRSET